MKSGEAKRIECVQRMIELAYEEQDTSLTCVFVRTTLAHEFDAETIKLALAWIKGVADADYDV
jgi:hypothetical protein